MYGGLDQAQVESQENPSTADEKRYKQIAWAIRLNGNIQQTVVQADGWGIRKGLSPIQVSR